MGKVWTHGRWIVSDGNEETFIRAWNEFAAWSSDAFPTGGRSVLLRDTETPQMFYSFGPWPDVETIERWRESEGFKQRIAAIRPLLKEFEPHLLHEAASVG